MSTKKVNYTAEQENTLRKVYIPTDEQAAREIQVKKLAEMFGKSTRSIVAKLTTMQLYVPKVYKTKKGTAPVRKAAIVAAIEAATGLSLESFEKANKTELAKLYTFVKNVAHESEEVS